MNRRIDQFFLSCAVVLLFTGFCAAQDRFESGKYKGFTTKTSFAIIELETPFSVRQVKGVISLPGRNDPLPNVLVEFRDIDGRIKTTRTDSHGKFRFGNLSEGTYMFKATSDGFQSVIGTVILRRDAKKSEIIRVELPVGV
jgi:hypothetical protein